MMKIDFSIYPNNDPGLLTSATRKAFGKNVGEICKAHELDREAVKRILGYDDPRVISGKKTASRGIFSLRDIERLSDHTKVPVDAFCRFPIPKCAKSKYMIADKCLPRFKAAVAEVMAETGCSSEYLAYILTLADKSLGQYLNGTPMPTITVILKLAMILNVRVEYLLGLDDNRTRNPYSHSKKKDGQCMQYELVFEPDRQTADEGIIDDSESLEESEDSEDSAEKCKVLNDNEPAPQRKERRTYSEAEAAAAMSAFHTQGMKAVKQPRINVTFTPTDYEYIKVMARYSGLGLTGFVNKVIEGHMEKHQQLYDTIRQTRMDIAY